MTQALLGSLASLLYGLFALGAIAFGYAQVLRQAGHVGELPAAPRRHPEPMATWLREACRMMDHGGLWLDEVPLAAQRMLASWGANDRRTWLRILAELLEDHGEPLSAWDGVRALRILMAGARLGWIAEEAAWGAARAIAADLGERHHSFWELAGGYLHGRRRWARQPMDGSGDDAVSRSIAQHVAGWIAYGYCDFRAFAVMPAYPQLRDIGEVRRALGCEPRASAGDARPAAHGPPPLPRSRCRYCRVVVSGRPRRCPDCGAPMELPRAV